MEKKKYQIFVSSTYVDLKLERQAISKAILDLGHIPVGMELFPATNASQLDYIKKVIDDCDYYVIVIGGRYGSIDGSGLSYTEQEFDYARQKDVPILAFIHEHPEEIPLGKSEVEATARQNLLRFASKVKAGRIVKFWSDEQSLAASVITSLTSAMSDLPRVGWMRVSNEISPAMQKMINEAKTRADFWWKEHQKIETRIKAYENLEESELSIKYDGSDGPKSLTISGETFIREVAPSLISGLTSQELQKTLAAYVRHNSDASVDMVDSRSVELGKLFLTVFEIAEFDEYDDLKITEKNKFLLQAAFKPLKKVIKDRYDDEIPF